MTLLPLYAYQETTVARLCDPATAALYLALDMGLGKTRIVIEAAARLGLRRMLAVTTASGRTVWPDEIIKWEHRRVRVSAIAGPDHFLAFAYGKHADPTLPTWAVVGRDRLAHDLEDWLKYLRRWRPDVLVLDEAHAFKNSETLRTRAVYGARLDRQASLSNNVPRVWCLSGTPAPNYTSELYPPLRALAPDTIKHPTLARPLTEDEFQRRYSTHDNNSQHGVRVIGSKNIGELRERTSDFFVRHRKQDVLKQVPPMRWAVVPLQLDRTSTRPLLPVPRDIQGRDDDALLTWLEENPFETATERRLLGQSKFAPALDYITEFLEGTHHKTKLLVFAHHVEVVTRLHEALSKTWGAAMISGQTPFGRRRSAVTQFQNNTECRVFVGQTQAAGESLTLTAASDVIFVEGDWTPSVLAQAAARAHRLGQKLPVLARLLCVANSLDERIMRAAARKARSLALMFDRTRVPDSPEPPLSKPPPPDWRSPTPPQPQASPNAP